MTQKTINIILGILTVLAFSFIQIIYNHYFTWALFYEQSLFNAFADLFYQFLTWNFKITFFPEENLFICVYFFLCVCLLVASFLNKKIYIIISIFSLYAFWYAIKYVFGSYIGDFEITSIPFFAISIIYLLTLLKQKIILIVYLFVGIEYSVYTILMLGVMDDDNFGIIPRSEYWNLVSFSHQTRIFYILLDVWNFINIILLIFVLYKAGKAVFNYFKKSENSQIM